MNLDKLRSTRRPQAFAEVTRICSLPPAPTPTPEIIERYNYENVQAKAYDEGFRLLPSQVAGLYAYDQHGGGFFNIAVGHGKTGLSLLIASHAYKEGLKKIMLLIPPSVYDQLMKRDVPWARRNLVVEVPIIGLGKMSKAKRLNVAQQQQPGLYVMPYSYLSIEDTQELLNLVAPELLICDEAHELRRKGKSAKVKRLLTYIERNKPRGVVMSGTMTSKTPMDYHHLIRWCLPETCPLPIPVVLAQTWSQAIESGAEAPNREQLASMRKLLTWSGHRGPVTTEALRKAYYKRLQTTPGYVTTPPVKVSCSLEIANQEAVPGDQLLALIRQVEDQWIGPNGEELSHGIETYEFMKELSAGFYYERPWPEDHPLVEQAKAAWHARQEYHRELREYFKEFKYSNELDTPLLVSKHCSLVNENLEKCRVAPSLYGAWQAWHRLQHPDLPERLRIPHRVDDYKVKLAVKWAKKHKHGIIWCHHGAMRAWVCEALEAEGIPFVNKGPGSDWKSTGPRQLCVASIAAHGTGKNLQHHVNQFVLQWPRPADQAEQMLGRCHREGQKADHLVVTTCRSLTWDHAQLAATLRDTVYFKETLGSDRKLLACDWNPLPQEFPEEFLRARGFIQ